jgi:hypothetical protein
MGISITGTQRDSLYQVLLTELSVFDDLRTAYERLDADSETSDKLGRMVADALRLIMDGGVGWGDQSHEEKVELTLPDGELQLVLARVRCAANRLLVALRPEYEERLEKLKEVELARETCSEVLVQLRRRYERLDSP